MIRILAVICLLAFIFMTVTTFVEAIQENNNNFGEVSGWVSALIWNLISIILIEQEEE